jgi:tRNA G46 methylase TrmB
MPLIHMYTLNMWSNKYPTYHSEDDYKRVLEMRSQCLWPLSYSLVTRLAQRNHAKILLEFGVAYGYHAHYLLETLPQITYIGVDPYLANYDLNDPFVIDVQRLFARQLPSLSI